MSISPVYLEHSRYLDATLWVFGECVSKPALAHPEEMEGLQKSRNQQQVISTASEHSIFPHGSLETSIGSQDVAIHFSMLTMTSKELGYANAMKGLQVDY